MENEISKKMRLLLNEVAILNQPEIIDGKIIYQLDTLLRIKSISTELYFLADQLSLNNHSVFANIVALPSTPAADPLHRLDEVPPVIMEKEIIAPLVDLAPEVAAEIPAAQAEIIPEIQMPPVPIVIPVEDVKQASKMETVETIENVPIQEVKSPDTSVLASKISLTRRFEYIHNLFAGDAAAFATFLNNLGEAKGQEQAMSLFDAEFEARNWRRRSESASELKQLLRKLI